jgi:hypothetical protein
MLRKALKWHTPLILFVLSMAALIPITAIGILLDGRTLNGAPIWFKPFKFAISFALYAATYAWLLSLTKRARRFGWWLGTAIAASSAFEMIIIVTQVIRGKQSHFNVSTPLDSALYLAMGIGVAVLWLASALIALILAFEKLPDRAAASAIRFGLAISFIGMLAGFLMLLPTPDQLPDAPDGLFGGHGIGTAEDARGMPVTGWSLTGGDLRVPHFLGLHALQVLPLIAMSPTIPNMRTRRNLVRVAGLGYGGFVLLAAWQALRGQPLVAPDEHTLAAVAVLVSACLVAAGLVAATRGRKLDAV